MIRCLWRGALLAVALAILVPAAAANVGVLTLPAQADDTAVTVFYPTDSPEALQRRGPFMLPLAADAPPAPGNGRLVVVSHGSGGGPWVHSDLARALVEAGFVVAMPWHRGDNSLDDGHPGPDSWAIRPAEVSRAIDRVVADPRFPVDAGRVGVYGMSAGGHTALSMAGGRWSRAGFMRHCDAHIAEDFQSCVGLATRLRGDAFNGLKRRLALAVIDHRFADDTPQVHHDPRVAAVVAAVPFAADFDRASLAEPRVPLALVTSGRDAWLVPRFHAEYVLSACAKCERLFDAPVGGHGAWLSPLPPKLDGLVGELLADPPGFDRGVLGAAHARIVAYFTRQLGVPFQRGGARR